MRTASARVILGDRPVGTAWRFHERYALTAAHCLGDTRQLRRLPPLVHVQFPGEAPLRARTQVRDGLDAALLEFVDVVPAGIPVLELAQPPRAPMLSSYEWRGIAYPLVNEFRELILTGQIRGYVHVDNGPALQLSFDDVVNRRVDGAQTLLSNASGAAVTYQQRAIGLVRASLEDTQIGHAVPIDRVASAFTEVRERMRDYPSASGGAKWRELDRDHQWDKLVAAVVLPESRTLVVPGAAVERHQTLLARLESFLAGPPVRARYLPVRWPDVSWAAPDLVAAISLALDGPDDGDELRLGDALRVAAAAEKLVVVHDALDPDHHADDLDTVIAYYQDVVPRLAAAAGHGVLWVQPIEWTDAESCAKARGLIAKLERALPPKIEIVPDLAPITADQLRAAGAPDAAVEHWSKHPTTREAYRLIKEITTGRSHGS